MQNVETMLRYFSQIRRVYAKELNLRLKSENFSPNEISILMLLSNNKTINTSSQLRLILDVSKSLISRSIDALKTKDLIDFSADSSDRRIQHIVLTPKAQPVIQRLKSVVREVNQTLLADIPPEEIRQMESTMQKIVERFRKREGEMQ